MDNDFLTFLNNLAIKLDDNAKNYSKAHPHVVKFWYDSFLKYIGKMKEPKDIKNNPRRFFHLHAINYLLNTTEPEIVWNLCPGNLKTIYPAIKEYFQGKNRLKFWINIDLVPEVKKFNIKFLENKNHSTSEMNKFGLNLINLNEKFIINIVGSVEDFFEEYDRIFSPIRSNFPNQTLICLDGIANVTIPPNNWVKWWNKAKKLIFENFDGWYFTWLNSLTLNTKFEFYFDVAVAKHNHPLYWVETSKFINPIYDSELRKPNQINSTIIEHSKNVFSEISKNDDLQTTNYLFRFYSDKQKQNLIYQTFYLNESGLKDLALMSSKGINQYIGHRDVDKVLFDFSTEIYDGKDSNFVKSIPYLGLKK